MITNDLFIVSIRANEQAVAILLSDQRICKLLSRQRCILGLISEADLAGLNLTRG